MIPKDEYSSGNRDDECWAKVYGKTKKEAEKKRQEYFDTYPTMGYNTRTAYEGWVLSTDKTHVKWYYILIRRWHSCD